MSTEYILYNDDHMELSVYESSSQLLFFVEDTDLRYTESARMEPAQAVKVALKLLAAASYNMDPDEFEALAGMELNELYRRSNE